MKKIHNYVDGNSFSISKNELPVQDPSTGEEIAKVVLSSNDDFKKILDSSKKSQIEWAKTTPLKRSRILSNSIPIPSKTNRCFKLLCRSIRRHSARHACWISLFSINREITSSQGRVRYSSSNGCGSILFPRVLKIASSIV